MKIAATSLVILLALAASAVAQPAPFDMTGERPATEKVQPAQEQKQETPKQPDSLPADTGKAAAKAAGVAVAGLGRREFIIPFETLTLAGENNSREWSIYLTPAQAQSALSLSFGYRNAIVIAPETSRLGVLVNDVLLGEAPVQSSDKVSQRSYDIPKGLLRPGSNKITFRAEHRHRTDCSIQSTYDLWSEIIPAQSYISFDPNSPPSLSSIDDVRAIGVNERGQTQFNVVVPKLEQPSTAAPLLRLTQGLAMLASMPNQSFSFSTDLPIATPGQMNVAVGTAEELRPILERLPDGAQAGGVAGFVPAPNSSGSIFVVTGPTWQAVESAIEGIVSPMDRPLDVPRDTLTTQRWTGRATPLVTGKTRLSFSSLGLTTTQFTGRRFRDGFNIGIPADFYADAYGEATIFLDAAYSGEVMPGSHIDIYVNGNIASTVPITAEGGSILRDLPISVTMRHFRPGLNRIEIEAVLMTQGDQICAPGAASSAEPRFALFDTSEFFIPDFARIAQLPNLAASAGTGFPYGRAEEPISLFMDRVDNQTLSATATLLGKLAIAAGRPINVVPKASALSMGDGNAIFVGPISQMPSVALAQTHISEESRTVWGTLPVDGSENRSTSVVVDEWRSKVKGNTWSAPFVMAEEWLKDTFDITLNSVRFAPAEEPLVTPPETASLVLAQGSSPSGDGTWLMLTAPTVLDLQKATAEVAEQRNWEQLSGYSARYNKNDKSVVSSPMTRFAFVPTQQFSFSNLRLIVANWVSTNILSYAAALAALSVLLGLATSWLLGSFGRKS
ncbi:cellulose biosynthesis cyclic di-GMP-binding regulatory protein BcsB [Sinorhizobium sp. BG8]|uniref:cellulose biosynthesis cyclic di-GMP-binding regulatory protein BcsB n=1 Tax=Sinorhizobium sp. BG8 TaxID=2613773 RepID=UPI00193E65AC|nr:cellulose biosynthesis cyclic di-GMP-binding regulatory protein BcsB [Sinorhizobium sp. BG8]QRM57703.1 cellulose biosynthesis cyclic di-GMP-binding regulatory protein BcsB [Sinorhizobium sp. BG8]